MSEGKHTLFLIGASHKSAPMELRERLYIDPDRLGAILPEIKARHGLMELLALSTCNRFELMAVADGHLASPASALSAFLDLQRESTHFAKSDEELIKASLYFLAGNEAVSHVCRVAASLDSLVIGETQITGQFKDALSLAQKSQTLGPLLGRLGQEALGAAKKVRTQTSIGRKTVSISHAAVELAQRVFGKLSDHAFLVIGAGEMGQVAAKYVRSYNPRALYVANRTHEKAEALVKDLGFGEAYGLDAVPALLTKADVILCSTAASGYVIDHAMVRRAQGSRRGRPLILLDVALPRDVDPACGQLDDVYLFDIDDLRQVVDANVEERQKAAREAEEMVSRAVTVYESWQRTLTVKPTLKRFRDWMDNVVQHEAERTLAREMYRSLDPKQRQGLEAMLAAIAARVSSEASRRVTNPPEGRYSEELATALVDLFALPVDDGGASPTADGTERDASASNVPISDDSEARANHNEGTDSLGTESLATATLHPLKARS